MPSATVWQQMNLSLESAEVERIETLARELNWSKRRVVVMATEMLEAALDDNPDGFKRFAT